MTGIEMAIQRAGSISALARKLNISHQVANRWVKRGHVPPKRAFEIELQYGVPARDLVDPSLLHIASLITS
jgi:DNA-binding transcriptional regulator YdaS (Cro superfamily)